MKVAPARGSLVTLSRFSMIRPPGLVSLNTMVCVSPGVTVIVGGAVLNEEYAEMIHADKYCEDAMDTVRFAQSFYSDNV